jgi:NhaA family Na+:H+ antiporter
MTWAKTFLQPDARPGMLMLLAAILALVAANTPFSPFYDALKETPVTIRIGDLLIDKPLLLWINDGLMALFFFLVGLEIKRETMSGELSSLSKAALPAAAAMGGMVVPALVYLAFNWSNPVQAAGWAIPAATDIAFALGVLALLGNRIPPPLRILLLGLAIYDDLGAILVIAFFYTADLAVESLALGAAGLMVLLLLNRLRVRSIVPYALVGAIIWVAVLKSGVHATLAGFLIALFIPLRLPDGATPLKKLEHDLHPSVAYFVIPIFAFVNAGVTLTDVDSAAAFGPVTIGIALGLFIGKQIGVMAFAWGAVRLGLCRLPQGVTWLHVYGVALLSGIGFTMSLFIGSLAFDDAAYVAPIRIGVLVGSILSAIAGVAVLVFATRQQNASGVNDETLGQARVGENA